MLICSNHKDSWFFTKTKTEAEGVERKNAFKPYLKCAFGYIEKASHGKDTIDISGWILDKDIDFDTITVYVNRRKVGEARKVTRNDVAKVCHRVKHAVASGFQIKSEFPPYKIKNTIYVCAVGSKKGKEISKIQSPYYNDITHIMPVPPESLIFRSTGQKNGESYLITGLRDFDNFRDTICHYVNPRSIDGILDWGCGSGRIIGFFSKYCEIEKLHACDIDAEAIKWGNESFKNVVFDVIGAWPPTKYPTNFFSVVISYSVLTHLSEKAQHLWLEEIARILVPKGLFLTTVHGESLLDVICSKRKKRRAIKTGIYDKIIDNRLEGIAPADYYRAVFHTRNYIFRIWVKYFEILEYRERGGGNWQDLVVMRKRK